MASNIKLKNANGNTLELKNNDAVLEDLNVSYFNTVEELTSAVGVDGDLAIVKDLDRGGQFVYDSTATDNQGTVFGKWERQYDGAVNVKWFGAVCDGVTDDTVAIQNAMNYSKNIYFPTGEYLYTEQMFTDGHILNGNFTETFNNESSIILFYNIPNGYCINNINNKSIYKNILFKYKDWDDGSTAGGLQVKRLVYAENCGFNNFKGYGQFASGQSGTEYSPYNSTFKSCSFDYNGLHGAVVSNGANLISYKDCFARWNGATSYGVAPSVAGNYDGIYIDGKMSEITAGLEFEPQGCIIQGGDISYNSRYGINYKRSDDCTQLGGYLEGNLSTYEINVADSFGLTVINPMTYGSIRTTDFVQNDPLNPTGRNSRIYPNHITRRGINYGEGSLNSTTNKANIYFNNSLYTAGGRYISPDSSGNNIQVGTDTSNSRFIFDDNTRPYSKKFYFGSFFNSDAANAFFSPDGTTQGNVFFNLINQGAYSTAYVVSGGGANASATHLSLAKDSTTNRTINAAGTVNASGADYAEYMIKNSNFELLKGDICGIDTNGLLTNKFSEAISFVVKSTDPSYVGGDTWASDLERPKEPSRLTNEQYEFIETEDEFNIRVNNYKQELEVFNTELEIKRASVDRIAFCGQVPVNVLNTKVGDYIIPSNDNNLIKGISITTPTFEEYQQAIGKVIAIEEDGRARIIVKVI